MQGVATSESSIQWSPPDVLLFTASVSTSFFFLINPDKFAVFFFLTASFFCYVFSLRFYSFFSPNFIFFSTVVIEVYSQLLGKVVFLSNHNGSTEFIFEIKRKSATVVNECHMCGVASILFILSMNFSEIFLRKKIFFSEIFSFLIASEYRITNFSLCATSKLCETWSFNIKRYHFSKKKVGRGRRILLEQFKNFLVPKIFELADEKKKGSEKQFTLFE